MGNTRLVGVVVLKYRTVVLYTAEVVSVEFLNTVRVTFLTTSATAVLGGDRVE